MGGVSVRDVDVSVLRFPAPRGKDLMMIIINPPRSTRVWIGVCVCVLRMDCIFSEALEKEYIGLHSRWSID